MTIKKKVSKLARKIRHATGIGFVDSLKIAKAHIKSSVVDVADMDCVSYGSFYDSSHPFSGSKYDKPVTIITGKKGGYKL